MAQGKNPKQGIMHWDVSFSYEQGDYEIGSIDQGDHIALGAAFHIGFNIFKKIRLGLELKQSAPLFSSDNESGVVDRAENPLPERSYFGYGPYLGLNFGDFRITYTYLSEYLKYKDPVSEIDGRSLYYKYEGAGHKVGLAGHLGGATYIRYDYHWSKYDEATQKIDGIYTESVSRTPLETNTHMISFIFPISARFFEAILIPILNATSN